MIKFKRGVTAVGDGGNGTSVWTPLSLGTALKTWYYTNDLLNQDGVVYGQLSDHSGNGRHLLGSGGGDNPTTRANGLASKPTMTFTAALATWYQANFVAVPQPLHLFWVLRKRTLGVTQLYDAGVGPNPFGAYDAGAGLIRMSVGNDVSTGVSINTGWNLLEFFHAGANSFFRLNRNTTALVNSGVNPMLGLTLGANFNLTANSDLDFAEQFAVDCTGTYAATGLTGALLARAQNYINGKWGV